MDAVPFDLFKEQLPIERSPAELRNFRHAFFCVRPDTTGRREGEFGRKICPLPHWVFDLLCGVIEILFDEIGEFDKPRHAAGFNHPFDSDSIG